jgi:hypothetical protein
MSDQEQKLLKGGYQLFGTFKGKQFVADLEEAELALQMARRYAWLKSEIERGTNLRLMPEAKYKGLDAYIDEQIEKESMTEITDENLMDEMKKAFKIKED